MSVCFTRFYTSDSLGQDQTGISKTALTFDWGGTLKQSTRQINVYRSFLFHNPGIIWGQK